MRGGLNSTPPPPPPPPPRHFKKAQNNCLGTQVGLGSAQLFKKIHLFFKNSFLNKEIYSLLFMLSQQTIRRWEGATMGVTTSWSILKYLYKNIYIIFLTTINLIEMIAKNKNRTRLCYHILLISLSLYIIGEILNYN